MTRQEKIDFYYKLEKSGRLEELKNNPNLPTTPEEEELLYYNEFYDKIDLAIEAVEDWSKLRDLGPLEAIGRYEDFKRTGQIKNLYTKFPWQLTIEEQELFYFDYEKGELMYNPFSGTIEYTVKDNVRSLKGKLRKLGLIK